ncbi:GntR family transcriptional regulator [Yinghuangia sp. ASG 101]|uniref:GntR family transcriptional regulator n=1 Tax=Yinghuangia sp. ASG 101 TaxID=2896848 RepID=UPI001E4A6044|nr:GntR family transcriptional regulator [Yinghuangia sp. ASG 101]UGQ11441.1 GntR family transcriptional regulator [Yinghuangia sp. ASG 101]
MPPTPDGPIVRPSSGEQTARYLRRLIFEGALRPGDRVPQDDVAQALGVSRLPVREALLSLEREGWVTIRPHRGAFIAPLDESVVWDHYALFGLTYGFAARRAALRLTPPVLSRLRELCDRLATNDDPDVVFRLNQEFDRLVRTTADSPRLRTLMRSMTGLIPGNFFALIPGAIAVERSGSIDIVNALARRDGPGAAAAYARMLERQGDLVVGLFAERGLFPDSGTGAPPARAAP